MNDASTNGDATVGPETGSDGLAYYFADLAGTVTWNNSGIWVGAAFRSGADWRASLRACAFDEAAEWTRDMAEHDVDFRLDMDFRVDHPDCDDTTRDPE